MSLREVCWKLFSIVLYPLWKGFPLVFQVHPLVLHQEHVRPIGQQLRQHSPLSKSVVAVPSSRINLWSTGQQSTTRKPSNALKILSNSFANSSNIRGDIFKRYWGRRYRHRGSNFSLDSYNGGLVNMPKRKWRRRNQVSLKCLNINVTGKVS